MKNMEVFLLSSVIGAQLYTLRDYLKTPGRYRKKLEEGTGDRL